MQTALNIDEISLRNPLSLLLDRLESAGSAILPETLAEYLSEAELTTYDLKSWLKFDESVYARNRVLLLPHIEVILMCWRAGQMTPIHDHRGSACAIKVLKGTATEITYKNTPRGSLVPVSHARYFNEEVFHSYDRDIHQMGNLEKDGTDLVTLHCYSPPLTGMKLFKGEEAFFNGYDSLVERVSDKLKNNASRVHLLAQPAS